MIEPPRSTQFDDVYFSAHNGAEETRHVFLDGNNLPVRWQGQERFTIAETGFGTGLNFLLAWKLFDETATKGAFLDFISIEKFPLKPEKIKEALSGFLPLLNPYLDKMLEQYPILVPGFHRMVFDGRVALTLIFDDVNEALPEIEGEVDAWFLDGFSPAKNPDMWSETLFTQMGRLSCEGTTFATFTAAGFVKRGLIAAGFEVTKKKGFAHKRDMLTGCFNGLKKRKQAKRKPSILIHGAGLAGCAAAYVLKQYGLTPVLYDPNGLASGASGNEMGLINPRLSAYRSAESDFYTAGFAQTLRTFPRMDGINYNLCGSLHLVVDEDKRKRFEHTCKNWGWPSCHMRYLSSCDVSDVAGIKIAYDALYLPDSAQVNPAALCKAYARDIEMTDTNNGSYDIHIFAIGAEAAKDERFATLPIHTVRGQITDVVASKISGQINTNICYGGYICAPRSGRHVVGSTFQKWLDDTAPRSEDDEDNLAKLSAYIDDIIPLDIMGHRAALRCASRDRFPIVGRLQEGDDTVLATSAHGSHGILSSLAAAHVLADIVRGGPYSLSKKTLQSLAPQRFATRAARSA